MQIRKFAIAGLVLAAVGLTVTWRAVVTGQQPGTAEESTDLVGKVPGELVEGKTEPAAGSGEKVPDGPRGTTRPSSDDGLAVPKAGGDAGSASSAEEPDPPVEDFDAVPRRAAGALTERSKSPTKPSRAGGSKKGSGMMGGMPGRGGMPGTMSSGMMPGGGVPGMAGGMMGMGGMESAPVSEDEHLETWVSRALVDYAKTEDQNARKQQRGEIAKALDRIFDIRQERRMQELETLEQRVQNLRSTLETRENLKPDIVKNRLDYLIREADGLGWGDGLPAPGRSAPTGVGPAGGAGGSSPSKRPTAGGLGTGFGPPTIGAGSTSNPSK